jgi:hypothetical protein
LAGWAKTVQISPPLPGDRFPWQWTYALFLEERWRQIAEISGVYGDPDGEGDDREVPKAYWHDKQRVDDWIARMKQRQKDRIDNPR